mgnify:CR=1 FL=1
MRVSLKWLRDYVDVDIPPRELARRLTMAGNEVASVVEIGAFWTEIYVARIAALRPHPNADRLQLVDVDYGPGRQKTVVTGARNLAVGDKVPFATVGAQLYDGHSDEPVLMTLRPAKLRGIVSEGMVCSAKELGLGDDHAGILILDPDSEVGMPLRELLGDAIIDIEVTPNRSDCLSMLGVAWEVAALTGGSVRVPSTDHPESGKPAADSVAIEILDPELCPRYSAALVRGVKIGPSPRWLQDRLAAAGVRAISNVVDVTNYVMLEWNQPLHAFDYAKLVDHRIIVRRARPGESIQTLDGQHRRLSTDTLLITDPSGPIAVAGVMGGLSTEITEDTTDILLESANFAPNSIRRTARALRLPSEASRRFERGLPAENTVPAVLRAAQLIQQLCGGEIAPGVADSFPRPRPRVEIEVPSTEVDRVLGMTIPSDECARVLRSLGYEVDKDEVDKARKSLVVRPPVHRVDVTLVADVIEDIIRIIGYDALPSTPTVGAVPEPEPESQFVWEQRVRQAMVGLGFDEAVTYSLTSEAVLRKLRPDGVQPSDELAAEARDLLEPAVEPLRLLNPLSADTALLRTSPLPGILEALSANVRQVDRDVHLFEIGRVYLPQAGGLPEERPGLAIAMGARRSARDWGARVETDFYDIKGAVEALLARLGVAGATYKPVVYPALRPGRAAVALVGVDGRDAVLGVLGEIAPAVRKAFDIDQAAFVALIDLGRLHAAVTAGGRYTPIPRYPAVIQDVAILIDATVPAATIIETMRSAGAPLARRIELFDVYEGGPIPAGQRSLAFHVSYQSDERTLTDEEVARVHRQIEDALRSRLGARVRGH